MLSKNASVETASAEGRFRDAFERLKAGKPLLVSQGSRVTQNNVSREAGAVPSALRGKRFPTLVKEIREWIENHRGDKAQQSSRQTMLAQRERNRDLRDRIKQLELQRNDALGKLVFAEARIVELTMECERLLKQVPETNVTPLRPRNG